MKKVQIKEIHDLLIAYAAGDYHKKGKVTDDRDEIDMIISGVNMLGEELRDTTVSRDYFSEIYNAASNMVLVLSSKGAIEDSNSAVTELLGHQTSKLKGQLIDVIVEPDRSSFFKKAKAKLGKNNASIHEELNFYTIKGKPIPVSCSFSRIMDKNQKPKGYLVVAEDITERQATENLILRTIVETQDSEQKRVADDLHDSLGQELSTVKLLLTAIDQHVKSSDEKYISAFETCKSLLDSSIQNIRSICFDLMPTSLERGGIVDALEELVHRQGQQDSIKFEFDAPDESPTLPRPMEIAIYRVAQEFISNSLKHAKASKISLKIFADKDSVQLNMEDDGVGFKMKAGESKGGRGLSNMQSRIKSYNGSFHMSSSPGKGTKLSIIFQIAG